MCQVAVLLHQFCSRMIYLCQLLALNGGKTRRSKLGRGEAQLHVEHLPKLGVRVGIKPPTFQRLKYLLCLGLHLLKVMSTQISEVVLVYGYAVLLHFQRYWEGLLVHSVNVAQLLLLDHLPEPVVNP